MSRNRTARASKTKAALNISAMFAIQLPSPAESCPEATNCPVSKLSLKFKRDVWNAYTLSTPYPPAAPWSTSPKSKAGPKYKRNLPPNTRTAPVANQPPHSPAPRQCKARLTRFHYGGPARRERGKFADMITLETPCLRSTCANCQRWHAHLMDPMPCPTPSKGTMRSHVDRITFTPGVEWRERPRLILRLRPDGDVDTHTLEGVCDVLMPESVIEHTAPAAASPETPWQERCTAGLDSVSEGGNIRFQHFDRKQVRNDLRRERSRLDQVRREVVRGAVLAEEGRERRPRRRQRLKLAFRSEVGKEDYGRLVGRYLH